MPEGDTIFHAAEQLRRVLPGRMVVAAQGATEGVASSRLVGEQVDRVEARGKHLLIHFSHDLCLHTHLGMRGKWRVFPARPQPTSSSRTNFRLSTSEFDAVCFRPKILELLTSAQLKRHRYLQRLGPDLLSPDFDEQQVIARFRTHNTTPIGEALMNQTIVCGIGNVYKSELLFLHRHNPFTAVESLGEDDLRELLMQARKLLRRNSHGGKRRTRFGRDGARLWVYGRSGEGCFECGTRVLVRRQGDLGRTTYWCPNCQRTPASAQAAS